MSESAPITSTVGLPELCQTKKQTGLFGPAVFVEGWRAVLFRIELIGASGKSGRKHVPCLPRDGNKKAKLFRFAAWLKRERL
jgi:hypothetical protein